MPPRSLAGALAELEMGDADTAAARLDTGMIIPFASIKPSGRGDARKGALHARLPPAPGEGQGLGTPQRPRDEGSGVMAISGQSSLTYSETTRRAGSRGEGQGDDHDDRRINNVRSQRRTHLRCLER
jgi:hypothetical protein